MSDETVEALEGTGWQIAVSQNPVNERWHWIAWRGPANFVDPAFIKSVNAGLNQHEATRAEAIEAATRYALDRNAGWVDEPMFDVAMENPA